MIRSSASLPDDETVSVQSARSTDRSDIVGKSRAR